MTPEEKLIKLQELFTTVLGCTLDNMEGADIAAFLLYTEMSSLCEEALAIINNH